MNLRDILDLVATSSAADWHQSPIEPMSSGVGIAEFDLASAGGGDLAIVNVRRHYYLATHVEHPHLAIAWGLQRGDEFHPSVCARMSVKSATPYLVDICWYGTSVHRTVLLAVDDHSCFLPGADTFMSPPELQDSPEVIGERAGSWDLALARLVDELAGHREFDQYVTKAGLIEVDRHPLGPEQRRLAARAAENVATWRHSAPSRHVRTVLGTVRAWSQRGRPCPTSSTTPTQPTPRRRASRHSSEP